MGAGLDIINLLAGLFLGILASLIAWWILFHCLSPKLNFSFKISKVTASDEPGGFAYRVKFENPGRREINDLSITARLRIKGLDPRRPHNIETTYLPVSFQGQFPCVFPAKKSGNRHLIRISVRKEKEFERQVYPSQIIKKAKNGSLTLEDILSIGEESTIQIIALGSDSFSGATKVFFSPEYSKANIVEKPFKKNSLETV